MAEDRPGPLVIHSLHLLCLLAQTGVSLWLTIKWDGVLQDCNRDAFISYAALSIASGFLSLVGASVVLRGIRGISHRASALVALMQVSVRDCSTITMRFSLGIISVVIALPVLGLVSINHWNEIWHSPGTQCFDGGDSRIPLASFLFPITMAFVHAAFVVSSLPLPKGDSRAFDPTDGWMGPFSRPTSALAGSVRDSLRRARAIFHPTAAPRSTIPSAPNVVS